MISSIGRAHKELLEVLKQTRKNKTEKSQGRVERFKISENSIFSFSYFRIGGWFELASYSRYKFL